jgi:hypothetical protein
LAGGLAGDDVDAVEEVGGGDPQHQRGQLLPSAGAARSASVKYGDSRYAATVAKTRQPGMRRR